MGQWTALPNGQLAKLRQILMSGDSFRILPGCFFFPTAVDSFNNDCLQDMGPWIFHLISSTRYSVHHPELLSEPPTPSWCLVWLGCPHSWRCHPANRCLHCGTQLWKQTNDYKLGNARWTSMLFVVSVLHSWSKFGIAATDKVLLSLPYPRPPHTTTTTTNPVTADRSVNPWQLIGLKITKFVMLLISLVL